MVGFLPQAPSVEKNKEAEAKPKLELQSISLGIYRSSGTYIYALLELEDERDRADILADVAKILGISGNRIQAIQDDEACSKCGISKLAHYDNDRGGECF